MQLSKVSQYALRLSYSQSAGSVKGGSDRVVSPSAVLLATIGITLSSFSVKQMFTSAKRSF